MKNFNKKKAKSYKVGFDNCPLYQEEKINISIFKEQVNLLNKKREIMLGCRHTWKYLILCFVPVWKEKIFKYTFM